VYRTGHGKVAAGTAHSLLACLLLAYQLVRPRARRGTVPLASSSINNHPSSFIFIHKYSSIVHQHQFSIHIRHPSSIDFEQM
jgi:hypothetical protein